MRGKKKITRAAGAIESQRRRVYKKKGVIIGDSYQDSTFLMQRTYIQSSVSTRDFKRDLPVFLHNPDTHSLYFYSASPEFLWLSPSVKHPNSLAPLTLLWISPFPWLLTLLEHLHSSYLISPNLLTYTHSNVQQSAIQLLCERDSPLLRRYWWCSERIALKQVYYPGWNRSPTQVGCMRQVLRAGALGRPRGMGWGEKWGGDRDGEHM